MDSHLPIKAIIFDVDGTLADTEEAHRIAFNQAFAERQLDWNWDVSLYDKLLKVTGGKERIKYYIEDFLPHFLKPADYDGFVKLLHNIKTKYYTALLATGQIPLRPGIARLILQAHACEIKLAIATTTTPENVDALLKIGLGKDWRNYFASVGCGDIVRNKKPAPDIYLWVLNELRFTADECIALEDSNNGLQSSLAAGIKTYITLNRYTRTQDFTAAAAVFEDLGNLEVFCQKTGLPLFK
jgi:HAD superfamily hydrolase (TIGR01509 family)